MTVFVALISWYHLGNVENFQPLKLLACRLYFLPMLSSRPYGKALNNLLICSVSLVLQTCIHVYDMCILWMRRMNSYGSCFCKSFLVNIFVYTC